MLRLVTAVVVESHDEWAAAGHRSLSEESGTAVNDRPATIDPDGQESPIALTA